MNTIKLHFCDFSADFVPDSDFFCQLLSRKYQIVLDHPKPDFLIYSCYSHQFLNYDCPRIFYTAENLRPDFNLCDYAIGFDYLDFGSRYFRFPNFARCGMQFEALVKQTSFGKRDIAQKSAFCNFIYSNVFADPIRDRFFQLLSQYMRVDSLGQHLNNVPGRGGDRYTTGWTTSKVEMQRPYKFSIAFENSSAPGYTTEKLMHAFIAGTVPIYWGNPLVTREFNPKSFINCHDFDSLEEVIRRVGELDADDEQYLAMLNEPCLYGNVIPEALREETLLNFFSSIFDQAPSAAVRRPRYGTTTMYEASMRMAAQVIEKKSHPSRLRSAISRILKNGWGCVRRTSVAFQRMMAVITTIVARTNRRRWKSVAIGGVPSWDARNQVIGSYIGAGSSVIDLGCGAQTIRSHIPPDCFYQPCDLVKSSPNIIVCDFNAGLYPNPERPFTHVVCSGVLEYIHDPRTFLSRVSIFGAETIISYNPLLPKGSKLMRMTHNWVNHLSQPELESIFNELCLSWKLAHVSPNAELIYKLVTKDSRQCH